VKLVGKTSGRSISLARVILGAAKELIVSLLTWDIED